MKKIIIGSIIGFIFLCFLLASATIVPAGNTGVIVKLGKVSNDTYSEGFHLKAPFITKVVDVSNKVQLLDTEAGAVSRDLQTVNSKVAINYRLASNMSASMYQNVGLDYENILIAPAAQEAVKSCMSQYSAENLITQRDTVSEQIKESLNSRLNDYGIVIEKFAIANMSFSAEFDQSIEEKSVSEQQKLKAEIEKEKRIIEAEAAAQEKTIAAQAEADAILAKAQAQAEANELLSKSINDKVLMNKQLEKWSGEVPRVVSDGGNGFIYDVNDD